MQHSERNVFPNNIFLNVAELVHHAVHHQVLLSSDSVCVQYSCLNGGVMGQYNVTLASTKPPPLIANTYAEQNRHTVGPVPQTLGRHYSAIGSMPRVR